MLFLFSIYYCIYHILHFILVERMHKTSANKQVLPVQLKEKIDFFVFNFNLFYVFTLKSLINNNFEI